jgi:hypothetical protein
MILPLCLCSVLFITFQNIISAYADKSFKQHYNFNKINHIKYHLYTCSPDKIPIWESFNKYYINNIIDSSGNVTARVTWAGLLIGGQGCQGLIIH